MGKEVIINPDLYFSNLNGELDFFMYKKLYIFNKNVKNFIKFLFIRLYLYV